MSSVELLFLEEFESAQDGWEMGPNLPRATGVNFTNVLRAAFTHPDPKSAK